MYLALVLFLQTALPPELEEERTDALKKARAVLDTVEEFDGYLADRFAADNTLPKTGLLVGSADAPGDDGLHALTVLGILRPSPAEDAGVRPGDRILRIGTRRIEHEPTDVAYLLLEDKPGSVMLAVARGTETLELTLHRRPLACLRAAAEHLDTRKWRAQLAQLRELLTTIADQLEKLSELPAEEHHPAVDAAAAAVVTASSVLPTLAENMKTGLYETTRETCRVAFE
jgi:hypothetical protein